MQNQIRKWGVRTLPALITVAFAGTAWSAEMLEEVIVTAQKRAERLQDVPISISAISGSQLETRGIQGAATLDGMVPNVQMKSAPGQTMTGVIGIRGVYTGQPAIWADPSIGIYVDGVFVGKNQGALFDLVDLERIEVLRGPQGTLFGRNTEGGAVSLISRKPSGEFSGNVGFEIGNRGRRVEKVAIDLPKVGIMSLGFALRNEEQDGWMNNPTGKDWGSRGRTGARLAAGFDFSPKFKVDYAYDRTSVNETPTPTSLYSNQGYGALYPASAAYPGLTAQQQNPFAPGNLYANGFNSLPQVLFTIPAYGLTSLATARQYNMLPGIKTLLTGASMSYPSSVAGTPGHNYFQKLDVDGHSLTATYELNANNTLKYIGAYRKTHFHDNKDLDGTTAFVYDAGLNTHYNTYSHEFQWIGNTERMNYVAGYYQFKDDGQTLSNQEGYFQTFLTIAPGYSQVFQRVTTDAQAIFGQIDYKLSDALSATVGVRRTSEEKGSSIWRTSIPAALVTDLINLPGPGTPGVAYKRESNGFQYSPRSSSVSFSSTTPVLALNYKVQEGLNVYGRMAKGFKSGGFPTEAAYVVDASGNVLSDPRKPFADERSTAYEVGFKSSFWDGKAQVNGALFRTDVTNYQTSLLPPGGLSPTMVNAGKLRNQGLELEGMFVLAPGWRLQFGYGYLDSKFKELMNFNQYGAYVDVASNTVSPISPKHTFNLTLDGRLAKTEFGTLRGIVDLSYSAKYYFYTAQRTPVGVNTAVGNTTDFSTVPAMTNVNARLLLAGIPIGGKGAADASIWVRNLTNNHKINGSIDYGGLYQTVNWTEPRAYGLSFNYKW